MSDMSTRQIIIILVFMLFFNHTAASVEKQEENLKAKTISIQNNYKLLITIPSAASANTDNQWFSPLCEQYLSMRLSYLPEIELVDWEFIHASSKNKTTQNTSRVDFFDRLAMQSGSTHILSINYEITKAGVIRFYADVVALKKTNSAISFERDLTFDQIPLFLDSCTMWLLKAINYKSKKQTISQISTYPISTSDPKLNKQLGLAAQSLDSSSRKHKSEIGNRCLKLFDQNSRNILALAIAAKLFESAGMYEEAIKQYKLLLNITPENAGFYSDICRCLRMIKKPQESIQYAAIAESKKVTNFKLVLEGALSLEELGKKEKALKAFTLILTADPENTDATLFLARQALHSQKPDQAVMLSDKIIEKSPHISAAYFEKGKALLMLKKFQDAEKAFLTCHQLSTTTYSAAELAGEMFFSEKQFSKAAQWFELSLQRDSSCLKIFLQAAESYCNIDQPKKALTLLKAAENRFPDSTKLQTMLGFTYLQQKDTVTALPYLEKILKKSEQNIEILMSLGDIYTSRGNLERAFYMFNHAARLLSDKTPAFFKIATLHQKKGEWDKALEYYATIARTAPHFPHLNKSIADAWLGKGDLKSALAYYYKARLQDSLNSDIQKTIASTLFLMKDYSGAIQQFARLTALTTLDPVSNLQVGMSLLYTNRQDKAEKYIHAGINSPSITSIQYYEVSNAYAFAKNTEKTIKYLQRSIAEDSTHEAPLQQLSEYYLAKNHFKEAAQLYVQLYKVNKEKHSALLGKAALLFEKDKAIDRATQCFSTYFHAGYSDPAILLPFSRIQYSKGNYDSVIMISKKIHLSVISDTTDLRQLSTSLYKKSKWSDALLCLQKLQSTNPNSIATLTMLAVVYDSLKNFNDAILTLNQAATLANSTQKADFLHTIGTVYEKSNNNTAAVKHYQYVIGQFPSDFRNYERLIDLYIQTQQQQIACQLLQKAVDRECAPDKSLKQLGRLYLQLNDKVAAVNNFKLYLEKSSKDDTAYLELAKIYTQRGMGEKALNLLEKAFNLNRSSFDISYTYATTHYSLGNTKEAIKLFEHAQQLQTNNIETLNYMVLCYKNLQMNSKLSQTLDLLTKLQPNNYNSKVELGQILLAQKDTIAALIHLECAGVLNTRDEQIQLLLSDVYEAKKNSIARFSHLKKAFLINPQNPKILSAMAQFYMEQKSLKTALFYSKKVLQYDPYNSNALYVTSLIYFKQNEPHLAIESINQAIKIDCYNTQYLLLQARIASSLGQTSTALQSIEKALSIDKSNAQINAYAGILYTNAGDLNRGQKLLEKALDGNDTCVECYSYLGKIAMEKIEFSLATNLYKKALSLSAHDINLQMNVGRALVYCNRYEEAKAIFEKIYQTDTNSHEAFYRLCHYYITEKEYTKVRLLMHNKKQIHKTIWDHLIIGEYSESQGNLDAAAISFEVALRLQPDCPEAFAGRGRISIAQQNYSDAVVLLKKAIEKDPQNPYIQIQLGKAYEGVGEQSSAFKTYLAIIDKYSYIPDSYEYLAAMKSKDKDHSSAITILKKGVKISPRSASLFYSLGKEFQEIGDYQQALYALQVAVQRGSTQFLDAYLRMACIYKEKLKNNIEAKRLVKKYLKSGGDSSVLVKLQLQTL